MTDNIFHIRRGVAIDDPFRDADVPRSAAWLYEDEVAIPIELAAMVRARDITLWEVCGDGGKFNEGARSDVYRALYFSTDPCLTAPAAVDLLGRRYAEATRPKTVTLTIEVPETELADAQACVELRSWKVLS